jgi:uncharacterized protein (TIGR02271 family)
MANNEMDRVVPLDQLDDFKVAEGDPDVRGWEVVSSDGRKIGDVDTLLVDTAAMKVRYLDVDVEDDLLEGSNDQDRHILIPIGYARLDQDDDRIFVDTLNSSDIRTLPAYTHEGLTRDYETSLRQRWDRGMQAAGGAAAGAAPAAPAAKKPRKQADFYEHEGFDENRFYAGRRGEEGEPRLTLAEEELEIQKRRHQAGEVDIRKHVETEHVRKQVPVMHEEVTVERRPVEGEMRTANARIGEDQEIRIPVTEEEVVVQKRPVVKEELIVKKHEVQGERTVEADVRRERAEIEREGDVDLRDEREPRNERNR